ncbi:hypothetical protein BSNK01_09550 [Bacillaceae bacterium]
MISSEKKNKQTIVKRGEEIDWVSIPEHRHLYHREIFTAADADLMGVRVSSVLWEKIEIGGAVLPHYHDVAEVIHITVGKVKLLCNGEWRSYQAGDTFLVPAGTVHSVVNDDIAPTEQISIFLPVSSDFPSNQFFKTILVNLPIEERGNQNV